MQRRRTPALLAFVLLLLVLISGMALAQTAPSAVNGTDILQLGDNITVANGQVVNDAVAVGGTITVKPQGRVTGEAIAVGGDVVLEPGAQVGGNAAALGGSVRVEQGVHVQGSTAALGGDVILRQGARVDQDASVVAGRLIREEGVIIGGGAGAVLGGMRGMHHRGLYGFPGRFWWLHALRHILTTLLGAVVGVVILRWRPQFLLTIAAITDQYPGRCALWGIGGLAAVIGLVILLTLTLIGIPLLPLVGLAVFVIVLLGALGVAVWVGQKILKDPRQTPVQQLLMGVLILGLIGLIPILGGLVLFAVNLVGFGAILAWQLGKMLPNERRTSP